MSEVGSQKSEARCQKSKDRSSPCLARRSEAKTSDLCPPPSVHPSTSDFRPLTSDLCLPPLRRDEFWALQNISFDHKRGEGGFHSGNARVCLITRPMTGRENVYLNEAILGLPSARND
jgi:hypothetical protein